MTAPAPETLEREKDKLYLHAFEELRIFNSYLLRTFAKECREERRRRRAG